jgi:hypothetical protein
LGSDNSFVRNRALVKRDRILSYRGIGTRLTHVLMKYRNRVPGVGN